MGLKIGDKAPAWAGKDTAGNDVSSTQYDGDKNVFLVFYPKAFSGVCAVQLPRYNSQLAEFQKRDTAVVAVSVDNAFAQDAFCNSLGGIDFPVVSDMTLDIAKAFGVALPDGFAMRSEFLIDKSGVLRWFNIEQSAGDDTPTMDDIFSAIDAVN